MASAVYFDPGLMWADEDAILAEADDRMAVAGAEESLIVADGIVSWSAAVLDDAEAF
jgi:hypothetical protein